MGKSSKNKLLGGKPPSATSVGAVVKAADPAATIPPPPPPPPHATLAAPVQKITLVEELTPDQRRQVEHQDSLRSLPTLAEKYGARKQVDFGVYVAFPLQQGRDGKATAGLKAYFNEAVSMTDILNAKVPEMENIARRKCGEAVPPIIIDDVKAPNRPFVQVITHRDFPGTAIAYEFTMEADVIERFARIMTDIITRPRDRRGDRPAS